MNEFEKNVDPDSEVVVFAKRTVKDLKLPPAFVMQIAQSIQVFFLLAFVFSTFNSTQLSSAQSFASLSFTIY